MPAYIVRADMSGTRNGVPWPPIGEVIDLPAAEGESYVLAGIVAPVEPPTPPAPKPKPKRGRKSARATVEVATADDADVETR